LVGFAGFARLTMSMRSPAALVMKAQSVWGSNETDSAPPD